MQMEAAKKYGGHMSSNFVVSQFSKLSGGIGYIDWLVVVLDNEVTICWLMEETEQDLIAIRGEYLHFCARSQ